jgi:cyclophilin family peptidyl-prolyl cis-trans isomerase
MISFDTFAGSPKGLKHAVAATLLGGGLLLAQPASATIVQVQTVLGNFEINLYDKGTPKTVANFLAYVNANPSAYNNNVVHRSEPGFVIQAGGFSYQGTLPLTTLAENAKVANEPVYSNVRGTIAMAKTAADPNSATNQWFISLADNSANLDTQNGGFTVFGQVTSGMAVVDAIAAVNRFNMGGAFTAIPLRNYTTADATAGTPPTENNLMLIQKVIVLDSNVDSAASLTPARNTLISAPPATGDNSGDGGGGGSTGLASLLALGLLVLGRKTLAREPRG